MVFLLYKFFKTSGIAITMPEVLTSSILNFSRYRLLDYFYSARHESVIRLLCTKITSHQISMTTCGLLFRQDLTASFNTIKQFVVLNEIDHYISNKYSTN